MRWRGLKACKQMGQYYYDQKQWAKAVKYLEKWYQRQSEAENVLDMLEQCRQQLAIIGAQ